MLLTNACVFDCAYCINRRSSNVRRARFSVQEVVDLTLNFYRRNYIEGLFLSSGIIRSSDYTMELIVRVARSLREEHGFRGYIHLKSIPDADPALIAEAGRHADRLSINVELPTESGLKDLAPEKRTTSIKSTMASLRMRIAEAPGGQEGAEVLARRPGHADDRRRRRRERRDDRANERVALRELRSQAHLLRGVLADPGCEPPAALESRAAAARAPALSGRLALSLLRVFGAHEIAESMDGGMLDLAIDPKLAWALRNRARFPINVNTAAREELLRIPGLGSKTVDRIIVARRHRTLRLDDLARLSGAIRRARPFLIAAGYTPAAEHTSAKLRAALAPPAEQLSLFA